ncbi:DUF2269 family protein [Prevotella sp. 10(H)]|uniref:DUF2269 family protein n=1 Tax=Prevotella sp. 10(H) TaxID=1158294 RepID=UPI0004A6F57C|nr:DUF2269 family protein [Prevotella sp. 10(H)]
MKTLGAKGLKNLKMLHLFLAIMWIGGAMAMTILAFTGKPKTGDELYMFSRILQIIDDYLIIPGAMGNILIGVVYGVWTKWGFFKQNWLTVKWIITIVQVLFGTFVLGPWINGNVELAQTLGQEVISSADYFHNLKMTQTWGTVQTIILFSFIVISVLKPWKKKA